MTMLEKFSPLFTDLYELTMAEAYFAHHFTDPAVFSLFIRNYPRERSYFVAAGLEDVLAGLEGFRFSADEIEYLRSTGLFSKGFLLYLEEMRFTGSVRGIPEGTVFFKDEPILEVCAPLIQAQILETFLLNTIGFQTMIATKAARCVHAAGGRALIDFSARRTQGRDAAIKVARSSFITGFSATSNLLAGKLYGIPVSGTMAHSYVTSFDSEIQAFEAYAQTYPDRSVFLIDTYDTLQGAENAAKVALEMKKKGRRLIGVRLDSGDMIAFSKQVRSILDRSGLQDVKVFASSGFDEYKIADAIKQGACIDAFGVGTKLGVSADAPYLDIVYKMVRFRDRDIQKRSTDKINLAGEKQVFRKTKEGGRLAGDTIGLKHEILAGTTALLETVMKDGRRVGPRPSLDAIRKRFARDFAGLDESYKTGAQVYPVALSDPLRKVQGADLRDIL